MRRDISRKKFIRMGAALGAGSAGAVALVGCGNTGTASLPSRTENEAQNEGEPATVFAG